MIFVGGLLIMFGSLGLFDKLNISSGIILGIGLLIVILSLIPSSKKNNSGDKNG